MISIFKDSDREKRSSNDQKKSETSVAPVTHNLRYPKPKILLVDLKDDSSEVLKSAGFKVDTGTFGESYRVKTSEFYEIVTPNFSLPNHREQEIIIIDLANNEIKNESSIAKQVSVTGNNYYWVKMNYGFVDSRPAIMSNFSNDFNDILKHGGVFIVFSHSRTVLETTYAKDTANGISKISSNIDNWSFLPHFDKKYFEAISSEGAEIFVEKREHNFYKFLERNVADAHYTCTLKCLSEYSETLYSNYIYDNHYSKSWLPTIADKYGNPVAGVFNPSNSSKGWIFVFPQIKDKATFLLEFVRDILPELAPNLFPHSENKKWIERSEYQSTIIQNLNKQIEQIEIETKSKIDDINKEIQQEKQRIEYQNKLLTDDGDSLVKAVEQTFKVLGFTNVINVDEEYKKQGKTNSNDEDLQIRDKPISILVEVKGVAGFPSDDDSRQITKHLPIRMKEWKEFDVKALSIINHQKAIPALYRDRKPFRPLIVESAEGQQLGLMTTFDLYRLVRSFLKNNWKHEHIKDLFIRSGHISTVPVHYEYVGIIENYWEKVEVVGIRVEENAIRCDDIISFELPLEFEEINVNSLQFENNPVEVAVVSMLAGIKTELSKEILKRGTRVFRKVNL